MIKNLSLTLKLILVFGGAVALILLIFGTIAYQIGYSSLVSTVEFGLISTAVEKEIAFNTWIGERQHSLEIIAAQPRFGTALQTFLAQRQSRTGQAAHDQIVAEFHPWITSDEGFDSLVLLDAESGEILASNDPELEGKFREDRNYFREGLRGPYVQNPFYALTIQAPVMFVSMPIRNDTGSAIGVLAGQLNIDHLNTIVNTYNSLYQSLDVYLVNAANLFISQPRLIDDGVMLRQGIRTESVKHCLAGDNGILVEENYVRHPVITVYRWLPARELCLLVSLDRDEILEPVYHFSQIMIGLGLTALALTALIAVAVARTITSPVLALRKVATRFGEGDLNARMDVRTSDEMGQLAASFNTMAASLAEERRLRYRAARLFDISVELLSISGTDGYFKELNPAWERTLGHTQAVLLSTPMLDFVHPDDVEQTATQQANIVAGETVANFENRFCCADGSYKWLSWTAVLDAEEELIYAVARNITKRKDADERLAQQSIELHRSNQELEQFAYVASHDLQEPLRKVSSYLQLIQRRYAGQIDEDADVFINFAVDGATRMKALINDLLAYSRVGTHSRPRTPTNLNLVLERVLSDLQFQIVESGASVRVGALPTVLADETQMVQLFQNLISNALKFQQGSPVVEIGATQQGPTWQFSVRDNGIGIESQYMERIFVIFQRLHGRGDYAGTGIGLAVCKKIVERHDGTIWVESEVGIGSTFFFTLPLRENLEDLIHDPATKRPKRPTV